VRDNKTALANYETQDMGKPIDEAEWDMVSATALQGVNKFVFMFLFQVTCRGS
jgi:acyl-CoA reductase-like NAD-dependent aldehyde dehydrogenase